MVDVASAAKYTHWPTMTGSRAWVPSCHHERCSGEHGADIRSVTLVGITCFMILCGCKCGPRQESQRPPNLLRSGDCLTIATKNLRNVETFQVEVDSEGNISLPFVGKRHVSGMSLGHAEDLLRKEYGRFESFSPRESSVYKCW